MHQFFRQPKIAFLALFFWLFASASGVHGHYCYDGAEPPVSVHFDLVDGDQDNSHSADHQDFDSKPMEMTLLKLLSIDLPFLALALLLICLWPVIRVQYSAYFNTALVKSNPTGIRPPLRAPPKKLH